MSEPYRIGGAVLDTDEPVRLQRITLSLADVGQRVGRAARECCGSCKYVRVSTDLVAVVRQSEGDPLLALPNPVPIASNINTLRHVPYLKARVATCEPVVRPLFVDTGQVFVLPYNDATISILAPDVGWLRVRAGQPIPPPTPGQDHHTWDVWIWVTLACTRCCPDDCAVLTDSQTIADGTTTVFIVPPHARRATISGVGGLEVATWDAGDIVVPPGTLPQGGFSLSAAPTDLRVVPDYNRLLVVGLGAATTLTAAWEVCP